jgi:hypothetical protein
LDFTKAGTVFRARALRLQQRGKSASVAKPQAHRRVCDVFFAFLKIVALTTLILPDFARAAELSKTEAATEKQLHKLIPDIEPYIVSGMKGFDVPGLAIGIVAGDKLNLYTSWLKDESLEDGANLRDPDMIAAEIVEDLEAALQQLAAIANDLKSE